MDVLRWFCLFGWILINFVSYSTQKYLEGQLETTDDWHFLARFCFLSQKGRLEFDFSYPMENYEPQNMLLYYDEPDQWPAVYKSDKGIKLTYRMWLTNGEPEDLFFYHFSVDEFYILQVDIAFLLLMFVMLVIAIVFAVKLHKKHLFHTTYKLYIASLSLSVFYLFIMCIAYGKYANNGLDNYGLKTFGRVFEAFSLLLFLLMLILVAKGYTITRGKLSTSGSIKIAIFMTLYTVTYVVLFIYEAYLFDPGEVLYIYESPAGYGLVGMRLVGWLWFCYAIFFTLKHYPEKSSFYYPFFIFFTVWFWATCFWILLANFAIVKYVRETVVNGALLTISLLGYGFFLILTRPSAANKNFPFHISTTKIGIMTHAPHQKEGSHALADTDQSIDTRQGVVVENAAPNLMSLFTVSMTSNQQNKYKAEEEFNKD